MKLTDRENEIRRNSCGPRKDSGYSMARIFDRKDGKFVQDIRKQIVGEEENLYKRLLEEITTTLPPTTVTSTTVASTVTQTSSGSTMVTSTVATTTQETTTAEEDIESKLQRLRASVENIPFATGIFISERHILTSSSFFIEKRGSKWYNKLGRRELNTKRCSKKNRKNLFVSQKYEVVNALNYGHSDKRIVFLNFCALQHNSSDFLTVLIGSNHRHPPKNVVCLPKNRTIVSVGDRRVWVGHILGKQVDSIDMPGNAGNDAFIRYAYIKKCNSSYPENLYFCGDAISCRNHHGAPVIETGQPTDLLVGVTISEHCDPHKLDVYHHVKAYMNDLCKYFNICNRPMTKIPLIPDKRSRSYLSIEDDYIYQEPEPEILDVLKGKRRIDNFLVLVLVLWCLF